MAVSSNANSSPSVGIIGAGKLGSVLISAFGKRVAWIVCHSQNQAEEIHKQFPTTLIYTSLKEITTLSDVIILTVPDRTIKEVAEELSTQFGTNDSNSVVIHCSGALGVDELISCHEVGMRTVAAHPFQTFTGNNIEALQGIAWGIECEPNDETFVEELVHDLGGIPVILSEITRKNKAVYHASAVVASNFVTMLVEVAKEFAQVAGINDVFLTPIIHQAVKNSLTAVHMNTPLPLTGPIARADISTLKLHRLALENTPLWELYSILSKATAIVAFRNSIITFEEFENIKNVVKDE
ncbi:MAG: DUF2520 domain-containing protein [Bacteroidetes bacterium]|nr:DUF2520 domain-containing protein [Bacteroidota bacterium]